MFIEPYLKSQIVLRQCIKKKKKSQNHEVSAMLRNGVPGMTENGCVRMPANAAAYAATIGVLRKEP